MRGIQTHCTNIYPRLTHYDARKGTSAMRRRSRNLSWSGWGHRGNCEGKGCPRWREKHPPPEEEFKELTDNGEGQRQTRCASRAADEAPREREDAPSPCTGAWIGLAPTWGVPVFEGRGSLRKKSPTPTPRRNRVEGKASLLTPLHRPQCNSSCSQWESPHPLGHANTFGSQRLHAQNP